MKNQEHIEYTYKHRKIVMYLANKYVKEETENYSSTALQTACASQSQEILKYLKKHGGDSKKKDSEGRSCKKIAKDNKAVWNLELIQ